jgi:hypothetical protein
MTNYRAIWSACLFVLGAACTDEDPAKPDAAADSSEGPLYVVASSFITGDDIETYLVTTDSFDKSTEIDPTDGPKLLGGIDIVVHDGAVFAPESNGPILVRYEPDARDRLVQKAELSFARVGLSRLSGGHIFVVNDTKGYVFDPAGPRLIVWNPQTMKLTGDEIDLADISRDGWTPNLSLGLVNLGAVRRGDDLLIPLGWQDQDRNSRHASGLLVVDTKSDAVKSVDEDERCGEAYDSIAAPNGDTYFFPPAWSSTQSYFSEDHQPTCILRVRKGETTFDPDYSLDLSAQGTNSAAAGAIPDGETGFFFLSVDKEAWDAREEQLGAFWQVWHYDFETESSHRVESLPMWIGHAHYVNLGDFTAFVYWEETDTGNRTTFYRVDGADDPERLFSFDASWYSFGKLR